MQDQLLNQFPHHGILFGFSKELFAACSMEQIFHCRGVDLVFNKCIIIRLFSLEIIEENSCLFIICNQGSYTVFLVLNFKKAVTLAWQRFLPDCDIMKDRGNYGLIVRHIL